MTVSRRRMALAALLALALVGSLSLAQRAQRGGGYESEPGGTPEAQHWQVLVLMGTGDRDPAKWDGSLQVTGGEIFELEGYRFELPDRVLPQGGWRMETRLERILFGQGGERPEQRVLPKGLLIRGSGTPRLEIRTTSGDCAFAPAEIAFGTALRCADGRIEVRLIPAATDLSGTELRQHDYPALTAARDGTLWATWSSYHDQREELNFRRYAQGRWTRLIPVGRAAEDLWRPQTAVDSAGTPWLIWAQRENANWDIFAMPWQGNEWGGRVRLSDRPLPDIEPSVATTQDGAIHVVWQALEGRYSQIHLRTLRAGQWSPVTRVTSGTQNNWEPAVAAAPDGGAWIAWDRYTSSYDIYCRRLKARRLARAGTRSGAIPALRSLCHGCGGCTEPALDRLGIGRHRLGQGPRPAQPAAARFASGRVPAHRHGGARRGRLEDAARARPQPTRSRPVRTALASRSSTPTRGVASG